MSTIDAFHLPGLHAATHREQQLAGDVALRFPVLAASDVGAVMLMLRDAAPRLRARPIRDIVQCIDAAAARFADRAEPLGRGLAGALLPRITGYTEPMIAAILDHLIEDLSRPALERLLAAELGDPAALDGFVAQGSRRVRAIGAEAAFHVFAGNVPGVAVTSLVRSLLTKTPTLGKSASGEPLLPALFARLLADTDPDIGRSLAVTHWTGSDRALLAAAAGAADLVVVYGGADAVDAVRRHARADSRVVAHGPRVSVGIVAREAAGDPRVAADAARAVALFDQQGCVSPQAIFVEEGGAATPIEFARALDAALLDVARALPRRALDPAEAAAQHERRGAAEFREIGGRTTRVLSASDAPHVVVFEPEPVLESSCLNRFVWVKPVDRLEDAAQLLRPVARRLQTVGVAGPPARIERLAETLAQLGATRITGLDRMPWPPGHGHHDGAGPLQELLRYVDLEP